MALRSFSNSFLASKAGPIPAAGFICRLIISVSSTVASLQALRGQGEIPNGTISRRQAKHG
jgi:hypothetical protein